MAVRAAHTKSMDESTRLEKNRRIAQSRKETRERRKNKDILVRTVKIQRNKLSRSAGIPRKSVPRREMAL